MSTVETKTTPSETVRKHKEFLFPAVATYYEEPFGARGAAKAFMFGMTRTTSISTALPACSQSASVTPIPRSTKRSSTRLRRYNTRQRFTPTNRNQDSCGEAPSDTPGRLKKSFFTNSGTEADDTAIHAAKLATGRHEIVVLRHSYSGRSATSLSAMGHAPWRPLPAQVAALSTRARLIVIVALSNLLTRMWSGLRQRH